MNTAKAVIGSIVADGIALAVTFGVNISTAQQAAVLAFVGSVTTAGTAIYAWHESHKMGAKAAVAAGATPSASTAAAQITNS